MEKYITKEWNMEDAEIEKTEERAGELKIWLHLKRQTQPCPECGEQTNRVHDYYERTIRDLEWRGKSTTLIYRSRRYVCPACQKRFKEPCPFVGRYQRFTYEVTGKIMELLRKRSSLKDIAQSTGTTISGVCRVLNLMPVSKPQFLPEAISFDEFKGNLGGEKFQCIVTDPLHHKVFDILPARTVETVQEYLCSFPNRQEVKYAVMDMNKGFREIARCFLPNASIVIDRFHVVRACTEAMENVRREEQKKLPDDQRRYFKRSRRLLLAHRDKLTPDEKDAVDVMLRFSDRLMQGYALKEAFYHFMAATDRKQAEHRLKNWLDSCDRLNIPQFKSCRRLLLNWQEYILNSFDIRLSNGFTEGCNNAIKTLKRVSFGCRNFLRFRKRILLSFSLHPNI